MAEMIGKMNEIDIEEITLLNKLKELSKQRWEIWKFIPASLAITFIIPHISKNANPSMAEKYGFYNATIFMASVSLIISICGSIYHIKKIQLQIVDTQIQLELLEMRKVRYKNSHIT